MGADPVVCSIPIVRNFADVFLIKFPDLPPPQEVKFLIELLPRT